MIGAVVVVSVGGLALWAAYRRGWRQGVADADAVLEYAAREKAAREAADAAARGRWAN